MTIKKVLKKFWITVIQKILKYKELKNSKKHILEKKTCNILHSWKNIKIINSNS